MRHVRILFALFLTVAPASAVEHQAVAFEGKRYTVSRVDLRKDSLELFLRDPKGAYFNRFGNLQAALATENRRLVFAVNAGMFHPGFKPVGLFISAGRMVEKLNLDDGDGNFFLKPNGVFVVSNRRAAVVEASQFPKVLAKQGLAGIQVATQSGPLLVLDGELHPAFRRKSENRLVRNGVGVHSQTDLVFAISDEPVNFHEFARLFRDELKCQNALFLDGTISSLLASDLKRADSVADLGPILAVTEELGR